MDDGGTLARVEGGGGGTDEVDEDGGAELENEVVAEAVFRVWDADEEACGGV